MTDKSATQTVTFHVSSGSSSRPISKASGDTIEKGKTTRAKSIDLKTADVLIENMAHKYGHLRVSELQGEAETQFRALETMIETSKDTLIYKKVVESIKKHFASYKTVEPGTVAAHFYGWFSPSVTLGGLPPECSPMTASSIRPPGTESLRCQYNVATHSASKGLKITTSVPSATVLIQTSETNFKGLTKSDIDKLKSRGITSATVMCPSQTPPSGSTTSGTFTPPSKPYQSVCENTPVDDLFNRSSHTSISSDDTECSEEEEDDCSDSSWVALLVIAIVVIVIIVLIAVVAYYRRYACPQAAEPLHGDDMVNNDGLAFYAGPGVLAN